MSFVIYNEIGELPLRLILGITYSPITTLFTLIGQVCTACGAKALLVSFQISVEFPFGNVSSERIPFLTF